MNEMTESSERIVGTVRECKGDFGFIVSKSAPGQSIYFKASWFRGTPPLARDEEVTFYLVSYADGKSQANQLERLHAPVEQRNEKPSSTWIVDWSFAYWADALRALKDLALEEQWEFKNQIHDESRPYPILRSYLFQTFGRLVTEEKVLVSSDSTMAAFHTGLVDPRYESIHALFVPNPGRSPSWKLADFCVAGEGMHGKNLVRYFNPLPAAAHYFNDPSDLLYDARAGKPDVDWDHIVIDNIDRFPAEFIADNCPAGFTLRHTKDLTYEDCDSYFDDLRYAIKSDNRTYRAIINRLKDALDLSVKRISWNFKTAIPQYYPVMKKLTLLLPICLVTDDHVDLALAAEKTESGRYLGHTIFPLDWAYRNARLICRPDSDWLKPQEITEQDEEDI